MILSKNLEDMKIRAPWYSFNAIKDKVWLEIDGRIITKRDTILAQLSKKIKNLPRWKKQGFTEDANGKLGKAFKEIMTYWNLDHLNFYLYLEDILRGTVESYNTRLFKPLYKATAKIAATSPSILPECRTYKTNKGEKITAVLVKPLTELCLATVSTFGALCEVAFVSVYSKIGQRKQIPEEARHCVNKVSVVFPGTYPGEKGKHEFCGYISISMTQGSSMENSIKRWKPLLSKKKIRYK